MGKYTELEYEKLNANMNINIDMNNDFYTTYMEHVIKQIVARDDENTKQMIRDYAMKKSEEIGQRIRVDFMDAEIVDEIIELGIREYLRRSE